MAPLGALAIGGAVSTGIGHQIRLPIHTAIYRRQIYAGIDRR
jgi:hypothetical protein